MNSGSFFRLDLETSKVVEGITYFDYIDLPDLNKGEDIVSYPIRLSISSERVTFFIHYYDCAEEQKPIHSEEAILDLPFKGEENSSLLSSRIKRIYNTVFPLSGYLQTLVDYRYKILTKVDKPNNVSEYLHFLEHRVDYVPFQNSKINKDSYSSIAIWGLLDEKGDHYNLWDKNEKITKLLRKLLLDFMFDLMHSDVFECSKYYNEMREGLMKDFFFSAIIKKSEYYYYRRLIRNRLTIQDVENESVKKAIKELYAEKLDTSEAEWIDVIMSPMANKHFAFQPEWYEDQPSSKKRKGFKVSESWFVNPEEEMERIVFPLLDDNENKQVHYLNSSELSAFIGSSNNTAVKRRKTKISKWFYQRYDFADTFRLHLFNGWNWLFVVTLGLFSLIAVVSAYWEKLLNVAPISDYKESLLHLPFISDFWNSPQHIAFLLLGFAFVLVIVATYYLLRVICASKKDNIDDFLVKKRRKREVGKAFRLALIFAIFGCFLFFCNSLADSWIALIVIILVLVGIVISILRIPPSFHTLRNIHLFLPRLVASITTAWIMLVIGNELLKERISIPIGVILSVVVLAFLIYESNKTLPNISSWNRIGRALELMLISFSMALIIGIFAIDIVSLGMLHPLCPEDTPEIVNYPWTFLSNSDACTITILPEYLIQFSFLAMFIGVFIQMIFEEKSITDM